MVNRNYAKPIGGGPMRPVSLFHKVPIQKAYDAGGIAGITDEWRQMPLISKIVIGAAGVVFAYLAIAKLPKD
jgi:hypothetical protein